MKKKKKNEQRFLTKSQLKKYLQTKKNLDYTLALIQYDQQDARQPNTEGRAT